MIDKLKKLIMFIAIIFGVTLFAAEETKAPNEIIKDNPKKEVTTVESMKVRDHATMSLSVTKSKPEEIMGSLSEDGKLSVFIYKKQARKMARSASTKDIDISNFKLKAYTNTKNDKPMVLRTRSANNGKNMAQNLSADDIRNMMNSGAVSKEKKINIVEDTPEYVRLEVEDVQENEKVYISVMDGESVVKSYRIGDVSSLNTRISCSGTIQAGVKNAGTKRVSISYNDNESGGKFLFRNITSGDWAYSVDTQYVNYAEVKNPSTNIELDDEFVSAQTNIGKSIALKVKEDNSIGSLSDRYRLYKDGIYFSSTIDDIKHESGTAISFSYWMQVNLDSNGLQSYDQVWFSKITGLSDEVRNSCSINDNLFRRKIEKVSTSVWHTKSRVGIYKQTNFTWILGRESFTENLNLKGSMDLIITQKDPVERSYSETVETYEGGTVTLNGTNLGTDNYNNNSLSFMKKNAANTGIYRGNGAKVIYNDTISGGSFEVNGYNTNNQVRVNLIQTSGKYVSIKLDVLKLSASDTFDFKLQQKVPNGSGMDVVRTVNYSIKVNKIPVENVGSITMQLDPRLQQIVGNEKLIGAGGDIVNTNITKDKNYLNMLKVTNSLVANFKEKKVTSVEVVGGKDPIGGGATNYKFFGTNSIREIGLKNATDKLNYYALGNDLVVSPNANRQYQVKLVGENKVKYNLDINVNYATGVTKDGYSGTGTLNMSGAKIGTVYTFDSPQNGNSSTNGMTMQVLNNFPNIKGIVEGKTGTNIANSIEISYRNMRKIGNLGDMISVDSNLEVGLTSSGAVQIKKLNSTFDYTLTENDHIKIKYKYNDIVLGTFTLKVKSKETDAGSITFQVDPRLKQLVDSKGNYITSSKTIGGNNVASHNSNNDYSKMINVATSYTNNSANKSVAGIYYIEGKVAVDKSGTNSGIDSNYIGFADDLNVTADIILKNGTGELSYYGSSRDTLISFASIRNLKGKLKHLNNGSEEAYNLNFALNYASGVLEDGYSGKGTVNVGAAELGQPYIFPVPTNGNTTTVSGMTMNISGDFPNTKGVVTGTTGVNIADNIEVTVRNGNQGISQETDNEVIGNKIYSVDGNLKVGLMPDGRIKIVKLTSEFDYDTGNPQNDIVIKYKYKDVILGTFRLKIKSNEVDGGNITFKIDPRLEQASSSIGTYITGEKTLGNESLSSHSKVFSELVEVTPNYQNGADTATNVSIISIKDKQNININTGGSYAGFGTSGSAEIILKKNPGALNYYSGNNKDTLISILNPATYESKIQDSNGKTYNVNFVMSKSNQVGKDGHIGKGTLNLTNAIIGEKYAFAAGREGEITGITTNSSNQNVTLKITEGKTLDATGVLTNNSSNRIANRLVVQNGKNSLEIRGKATGNLSQSLVVIGVDIGINEKGELTVTKTEDIEIKDKELSIDYYYDVNGTSIHLGNFKLIVTNERIITPMGDIEVRIDSRLANISAAEWVRANGILHDSTGEYGDYSKLIKATDNTVSTLGTNEVITIESINGNTNLDDRAGTKATYKYLVNGNNIAVLPYSTSGKPVTLENYGIDNKSLIFISKRDISTNARRASSQEVTNNFVLVAKATPRNILYSGAIKEIYLGKKNYSGSGDIDLGNSTIDEPYIFKTTVSNRSIESNNPNIKITGASDDPVNSLDIFGDSTNIANKLKVTFTTNGNTRQSRTTTLASNTLEVTEHNLSVGIDTATGGLTLTRKGGSNVTKAVITYYYDPEGAENISNKAVTLGTFTLNITNANPVTNLGTLRTVIDPRLGNLKNSEGINVAEKEWLTLDGYTGTNLETLVNNEYNGLIRKNIDGNLTLATELKKIIKVSKGETQYDKILGGAATYTRFGTKSPEMPYVAIKLVNGGSLDTSTLTTDQNFVRKVSDIGAVTVEAEGELNQRYSFKHDLAIASIPISGYEPSKGYVGTGSIDLGNTPISDDYYVLVPKATKSFKNSNSEEEIQLDNSTGTLPNLTGLVKEYRNQVIASKYTVTINGKEEQKKNLGDEVDIVPNQVKIKLESGTDGKQLKIKKLTDEDVSLTTVIIKYYHESGIQLGEYDLTISNSSKATLNGTITTEVDPRFIQVDNSKYKSYWLATNDIVGNNLETENLVTNMTGIVETSLDVTSNIIDKVIEIRNTKNGIYEKVTGKVGGYTKYYIDNEGSGQNFAVKLGEDISTGGTIARKYSDNENGDLTIKYVDESGTTPTKKSFTHKLKLVEGPTDNFTAATGYSGSGTVDLSNKNAGKYRIVKPQEPSPLANNLTDLEVESYSGHFPVLTGLVTKNVIATHYSINGGANYIAVGQETELEANKLKITLDGNGDIILERMGSEKITKNSVTIDYFYFPEKDSTSSTKIKLGSFTLNINDSVFELDPKDQTLDFGKMFYDSRDGLETHETRVKTFTLKAHGKEVDFRVADTSKMTTADKQNEIELINVGVTKKSNTEFELGATAVLNENTAFGTYNGEIQVIVDIVTPSNP